MAEAMVGIHLLIGIAVELGLELVALLDIVGKSAVDWLIPISRMSWFPEISLAQRRVLSKRRGCGLGMVRPYLALVVIVKRTIESSLGVGSGQLGVYGAAVEEVWVGIAAVGTGALVEGEGRATELVVPRFASKAARVPADAVAMALIHGLGLGVRKGDHVNLGVVNSR
jgi:hypothetical protein